MVQSSLSITELKGLKSLEIFCLLRKQAIFALSNHDINKEDIYKLCNLAKDKNGVPYNKTRIQNLSFDKAKEVLEFVLNNLDFDLDYKPKDIDMPVKEFKDANSVLLFYCMQKLFVFYYDEISDRTVEFVEWCREFKKDKDNIKDLIVNGCITLNDCELILSFCDVDYNLMDYKDIIDLMVHIVYNFVNIPIFYFEDMNFDNKNFSYSINKYDGNIKDILATITSDKEE